MTNQCMWLNLKLDLLPCIAQEVEKITKDYLRLSDEVRKGDNQSYQELVSLQANIRARIEEFDRFYDRNYADYRIGYFEKMKLRLRKLLSPHVDVNRVIYEDGLQFQNRNSQPFRQSSPHEPPPNQNSNASPQQYRQQAQSPNQSYLPKQQLQASKSPQRVNTSIRNDKSPVPQQQTRPVTAYKPAAQPQAQSQITSQRTTTKGSTVKKGTTTTKQAPTKSDEQKDELVFTIKMSKEEYLQYLQAKQMKYK